MADEHPADDPALATAARHALHDEEIVAAFAAGTADDDEAARARLLIDRCATCTSLARDVEAITAAVRSLRDAALADTKAPRDFRITVEQAAELRPSAFQPAQREPAQPEPGQLLPAQPQPAAPRRPGFLERVRVSLFGATLAFARPLGATLATFGLVGLLVGTVSLAPAGSSGSMPALAPAATDDAGPGFGAAGGQPGASVAEERNELQPLSTKAADQVTSPTDTTADNGAGPSALLWLFAGSIVLLVLGLGLLLAGFRGTTGAGGRADSPGR